MKAILDELIRQQQGSTHLWMNLRNLLETKPDEKIRAVVLALLDYDLAVLDEARKKIQQFPEGK